MRKRIAAGLLAFALAFTAMDFGGLVSIQANAAGLVQVTEENQSNFPLNGDYAGYYAIADKEDLQAFAAKVNAGENAVNAVLTADIDMTGEDWTPIGDTNDGYTGTFDGNGHKISKLVCERTGDKQVSGLFAVLMENSVVKNLGMEDGVFTSSTSTAGAVAAKSNLGKVINCWNSGKVTAHDYAGGIVGSSKGWIESCKNSGAIKATWGYGRSGGIAGEQVCGSNSSQQYVRTYIKYCYNTGTADAYYAGGIVGYQGYRNNEACDIISCWSDAAMTGSITGGIAGSLARGDTIQNCVFNTDRFKGGVYNKNQNGSVKDSEGMTSAEFASGKAAWVLNGKDNSLVSQAKWFQNLEENPDAYPVMDGTHGKVYYLEKSNTYSNHPGSIAKNEILLVSGTQMVKTSDNLSQTKPLSLKKDEVFSWKGDGQIIVGYYLDEKAQIPTTAQNSGAVEKAGAPALPGQYYVKVTALEVKDFYQETSEIFSYQINFDARIRMQRIEDSESIDYAYTGNPRELSLEKGRKITWSCRETPTSIKTTYYKSKDGVLTNAENAGALTEGGAPAAKGDYYVKAELTFREKYKSESDYLLYKISDGEIEVTMDGDSEPYVTLAEAFRDTERKTAQMKLLKNIELKGGVEVNSGNLILDLNGYRLQSLRKILLNPDVSLKITDSSETQTGVFSGELRVESKNIEFAGGIYENQSDNYVMHNSGKIKVSGGKFERISKAWAELGEERCLVDNETNEKQPYAEASCTNVHVEVCKEHDYEQDLQYCTWCHKRKPDFQGYIRITVNGEETYVNTLKEAFEYANGKEAEITLMQSMENTDNLPALTRGKISLDLNQKSLTEKNASLINILGAEVTVKNGTCDIPIKREQGKLKIESGNFQILKDQSSFRNSTEITGGNFQNIISNSGSAEDMLPQGYAFYSTEAGRFLSREEVLANTTLQKVEVRNTGMSCETLPQISGIADQTLQKYTLISGVVRADTGNGESTLLEGTWSFKEEENLEVIPKAGETMTCDLIFTPEDDNYPYYKVKGVEVHVEKKTPQQAAFHESASYIYIKGSDLLYVDLQAKLPADKKGDRYSWSVTGDEQIFARFHVSVTGELNYRVNKFTDRSMIGKTVTLHVTIEMENYTDVSYDLTVTLTDRKKVVLKEGSEVKVLQDQKLTYGGTLSDLKLNLEGEEQAVFVEQGTDKQVQGSLVWNFPTQRPDTSVTSAKWIFTPYDIAYVDAVGSTAITVEPKELKVLAATADDKVYDGTADVSFSDIVLEGIEEGDEVSADIGTIRGTLKDAKAGNYTSVTLPELRLTGKDKENYILVQPTDEIPLTKAVNVAKSSGLQIEEQNKSYLYLKNQEERINLREILPVDCGNAQYAAPEMTGNMEYITEPSITDDILSYTVKQGALDRKGKIQIKVTTENYEDFVITFNLECNDQIPVRLQEGTQVTLKKEKDTLTYGDLLSALEFSEAEFVDGEGNTVEGTLAWKDATQRPDTSVTSAEWIFTPDDAVYANAEGSTAITVEPKELKVLAATADDKVYDGTADVSFSDIVLEGIEEGDEVSADIGTIRGTLKDAKAGNYTSVTLPELRLTGKDKENYILVQPTDEIPLTKAVNVAKSSGLQIEEQNKSYLYLKNQEERINLREILPVDCGNAQYAAPEMTGNMEYITEPSITDDILSYTVKQGALDRKGKIQIKVTTENYEDFVITFNLECNDQIPVRLQEGTQVTLKKEKDTLTYGDLLSALEFSEAEFVDGEGNTVEGTLAWKDATQRPDTSVTSAEWIFTPDDAVYANAEGSTAIKVNAKELTVTKATAKNRKYDGTNQVSITEVLLNGMLEGDEVSVDLTDLYGTLKDKKAGEYTSVTLPVLTLAGKDKANYRLLQPVTEIPLTKAVTIETQETTDTTETPDTKETPETPQKPSDPGTKPGTSEPIQKPSKTEYLKKGRKFTGADNNQYKVTCADGKTFTVVYLKPKKGVKGTVNIPDSITVNHVTYKVTEIAANAFKKNKKIRKVVIPSGIEKIGKQAFYGCKNLKNITVKTTKLTKKRVGSKAFSGIHAKAAIKVPKKKLSAYRKMLKARGVAKKENVRASR